MDNWLGFCSPAMTSRLEEGMGDPAATTQPSPAPAVPLPTIHEAERASGPSGAVIRGAEIDMATAVGRRQAEQDWLFVVTIKMPTEDWHSRSKRRLGRGHTPLRIARQVRGRCLIFNRWTLTMRDTLFTRLLAARRHGDSHEIL